MTLTETHNLKLVGEILADSGEWDGREVPILSGVSWMLAKTGEKIVGSFMVERKTPYEIRSHICILKEFRGPSSFYAVEALLDWFSGHPDGQLNKLTVEIPEWNLPCIRLAQALGFKKEGFNRESVLFEGKFIGQHLLGITREEAK